MNKQASGHLFISDLRRVNLDSVQILANSGNDGHAQDQEHRISEECDFEEISLSESLDDREMLSISIDAEDGLITGTPGSHTHPHGYHSLPCVRSPQMTPFKSPGVVPGGRVVTYSTSSPVCSTPEKSSGRNTESTDQSGEEMCRSLLSMFSDTSSYMICRICHEGEKSEKLISPCRCTGTMGLLHISCIEKWLGSSNTNKCEICNFEYQIERRPRPFREWWSRPSQPTDHRNLVGDIICFCLLTPLAAVSAWLCITGALHYSEWEGSWESSGLLCLTVFLIVIYLVWCLVAFRYHYKVWQMWRINNQIVRVVDYKTDTSSDMNNNIDAITASSETTLVPTSTSSKGTVKGNQVAPKPKQSSASFPKTLVVRQTDSQRNSTAVVPPGGSHSDPGLRDIQAFIEMGNHLETFV